VTDHFADALTNLIADGEAANGVFGPHWNCVGSPPRPKPAAGESPVVVAEKLAANEVTSAETLPSLQV
jgi:hypothetical protein